MKNFMERVTLKILTRIWRTNKQIRDKMFQVGGEYWEMVWMEFLKYAKILNMYEKNMKCNHHLCFQKYTNIWCG